MTSERTKLTYKTVTIADGETLSEEVWIGEGILIGLKTDAAFDAGDISFRDSIESGGTFTPCYDANDSLIVSNCTASRTYNFNFGGIEGLNYTKLSSSVTQSGDTVITLIIRRRSY